VRLTEWEFDISVISEFNQIWVYPF